MCIEKFKAGDIDAVGELYKRYHESLVCTMRKRFDEDDAEEFAAAAWVKAFEKRDRFRQGNFPGWLYTIARNLGLDELRKRHRHAELLKDNASTLQERRELDVGLLRLEHKEMIQAMQECMETVPGVYVRTLIAYLISGQSTEEIAEREGISTATVAPRKYKALKKLRSCIEGKLP